MCRRIISDSLNDTTHSIVTYNGFHKQILSAGLTPMDFPMFSVDELTPTSVNMCIQDIQNDTELTYEIGTSANTIITAGTYPVIVPALPLSTVSYTNHIIFYKNGERLWFENEAKSLYFYLVVRATAMPPQLSTFTVKTAKVNDCTLQWTVPANMPADTRLLIIGYPTYNWTIYNKPVNYMTYWEQASTVWGQGSPIRNPYLDSYPDRRVVFDGLASVGKVTITGLSSANRYWFGAYPFRQMGTDRASGLHNYLALSRIFQNSGTKTINAVTPRA